MRPRLRVLALLSALVLCIATPGALGHSSTVTTSPAAGAKLSTAPSTVRVTFNSQILRVRSAKVLDPAGANVATRPRVSATNLRVALMNVRATRPGLYRVSVSVVGVDSHVVTSTFSFTVRAR